jgi:hypothetical protein
MYCPECNAELYDLAETACELVSLLGKFGIAEP